MKDLVIQSISNQFIVKVYGIIDKFSDASISTDEIIPLGNEYKELNLVRVAGYDFAGKVIAARQGTLLVLPGKGIPVKGSDPFGNSDTSCWRLPKNSTVGNIEISSSELEDLIPKDDELGTLSTRLQIKDYSYENGRLKARIEWELSAGPFSYSDHLDIDVKTSLGSWTKVGQVGPVKVYVKMPSINEICAKAEVKVGWPINSKLKASECVKI